MYRTTAAIVLGAALMMIGAGQAAAQPGNKVLSPLDCHKGGGIVVDAPENFGQKLGMCRGGQYDRLPVYRGK